MTAATLERAELADWTYEQCVEAALVVQIGRQWALGKLAVKVGKSYGENLLGQYAEDIGENVKTLYEYRATYVAWENSARAENLSYKTCAILAAQPDRADIVAANPKMTVKQARELVRSRKEPTEQAAANADDPNKDGPAEAEIVSDRTEEPEPTTASEKRMFRRDYRECQDYLARILSTEYTKKERAELASMLREFANQMEGK